jgi:membrane associated rhomboid family serine protease
MGIYDRDYYGPPRRQSFGFNPPRTALGLLLALNIGIYVVDVLSGGLLTRYGALSPDALFRPWLWWQFVTYGFLHDTFRVSHILFNMLGLWFFGRDLENLYGRKRFLQLYFLFLVAGAVVWAVIGRFTAPGDNTPVIGASGAITGMFVLFCVHYPRVTILLFFIIPVPAWVAGVFLVGSDVYGQVFPSGTGQGATVAYLVHLGGAATALLYYYGHAGGIDFAAPFRRIWQRRPKLRVFTPDAEESSENLSAEVDRILAKISREGEASLTRKERHTLASASRAYQKRRVPPRKDSSPQ